MSANNGVPDTAEFARIPETCRRFGLSRSRLYREATAGNVRFLKLGAATVVDLASVRALMASLPEARLRSPKATV